MHYTLEHIYQCIGQSIINSAIGEWEKSVLKISFQKGMVGYNLNFYKGNDYKSVKFNRPSEMTDMVNTLHDITTNQHNSKWNKLDFTLFPEGKFNLNFIWDQEWQNEVNKYNKRD